MIGRSLRSGMLRNKARAPKELAGKLSHCGH